MMSEAQNNEYNLLTSPKFLQSKNLSGCSNLELPARPSGAGGLTSSLFLMKVHN